MNQKRFIATIFALVLAFSTLSLNVLAAAPSNNANLCQEILSTIDELYFSAESLEVEAGKFYEVQVLPAKAAKPLGWQFDSIELSNSQIARVHIVPPEGVEVISTDSRMLEEEPTSSEDKLSFVIEALKSGKIEFKAELSNPAWIAHCNHGHVRKVTVTSQNFPKPVTPIMVTAEEETEVITSVEATAATEEPSDGITNDQNSSDVGIGTSPHPHPTLTPPPVEEIQTPQPQPTLSPDVPEEVIPKPSATPEAPSYNISDWTISADFNYDGQAHLPAFTGVPDDVVITYSSTGEVDAGTYEVVVKFEVPEGHTPISDMVISYQISPSVVLVEHQYNPETGQVETVVSGIVDGDLQGLTTTVNGEDNATATIDAIGNNYKVNTMIDLDKDKADNYVVAPIPQTIYDTKSSNAWFDLDLSYKIENGQLVVSYNINNAKIPQVGTNDLAALSIYVVYDKTQIQYDSTDAGYWSMPSDYMSYDFMSRDIIAGSYAGMTGPLPANASVCTAYYNIIGSGEDIILTAYGAYMTNNLGSLPFYYDAGSTTIVANPTGAYEVETIILDRNPLDDVRYKGQGTDTERAEDYAKLEEHIAQVFPNSVATVAETELTDVAEATEPTVVITTEEAVENTDTTNREDTTTSEEITTAETLTTDTTDSTDDVDTKAVDTTDAASGPDDNTQPTPETSAPTTTPAPIEAEVVVDVNVDDFNDDLDDNTPDFSDADVSTSTDYSDSVGADPSSDNLAEPEPTVAAE